LTAEREKKEIHGSGTVGKEDGPLTDLGMGRKNHFLKVWETAHASWEKKQKEKKKSKGPQPHRRENTPWARPFASG